MRGVKGVGVARDPRAQTRELAARRVPVRACSSTRPMARPHATVGVHHPCSKQYLHTADGREDFTARGRCRPRRRTAGGLGSARLLDLGSASGSCASRLAGFTDFPRFSYTRLLRTDSYRRSPSQCDPQLPLICLGRSDRESRRCARTPAARLDCRFAARVPRSGSTVSLQVPSVRGSDFIGPAPQ